MEEAKFWLAIAAAIVGPIGTWAVMREKVKRIDVIEPEIALIKTAVAVLQSKQEDHGTRIDGFTEAIQAMEKRIVEQVRQLFEAFTRGGNSGGK